MREGSPSDDVYCTINWIEPLQNSERVRVRRSLYGLFDFRTSVHFTLHDSRVSPVNAKFYVRRGHQHLRGMPPKSCGRCVNMSLLSCKSMKSRARALPRQREHVQCGDTNEKELVCFNTPQKCRMCVRTYVVAHKSTDIKSLQSSPKDREHARTREQGQSQRRRRLGEK